MSKHEKPWFVVERALNFVKLALTEHRDVVIRPYVGGNANGRNSHDVKIDILAEALNSTKGGSIPRRFGVLVEGFLDLPPVTDADKRPPADSFKVGRDPFEASLPICLFQIGARDLDGRYCWIVAPVVEHGQAQLLRDNKPTVPHDIWHKVDDAGIRRLVAEVNAYYDAVAGQPTGKTPRRAVNSSS
jgi:hypothetical protein